MEGWGLCDDALWAVIIFPFTLSGQGNADLQNKHSFVKFSLDIQDFI